MPTVTVPPGGTPPVIDGALTDDVWRRPPDFSGFKVVGLRKGVPAAAQTEGWICRDDARLCFAFRCRDLDAGSIVCNRTERDLAVHQDESIEIFISPGTDGRTYHHFIVSATGVQRDNRTVDNDHNVHWDGHWRSAARIDDGNRVWTVEVAVPLFYLTENAGTGPWRINVARNKRHGRPEPSSWVQLAENFHAPGSFGVLEGLAGVSAAPVFAPVIESASVSQMIDLPDRGFNLTMMIRNHGGAAGCVRVHGTDVRDDGETDTPAQEVALGGGHEKTLTVFVPVEFFVRRQARAAIALSDARGDWAFTRTVSFGRSTRPMNVAMDRSWYTTEETGFLICRFSLPLATVRRSRLTVSAPFLEEAKTVVPSHRNERVFLPVATLEPGTYPVTAALTGAAGKAIATETCDLIRRPPCRAGVETKTDRWNGCVLVDGEPYFAFGFYGGTPNTYALAAWMGANTMIHWGGASTEQMLSNLDRAEAAGLRLFASPIPDYTHVWMRAGPDRYAARVHQGIEKALPDALPRIKTHPALLAWHLMDEAHGPALRDAMVALYGAIAAGDGCHVACPGGNQVMASDPLWQKTLDLGFAHTYWHPHGAVARVADRRLDRMDRAAAACRDAIKPFWIGLGNEFHSITRRMNRPQERRVDSYLAMIHGATGMFYFIWPVRHSANAAMYQGLREEIEVMKPALCRRAPEQVVTVEGAGERSVMARLSQFPNGDGLLLAANLYNGPVTTRFAVDGLAPGAAVERLFGDGPRRFTVGGDGFGESLEAYAARAYRLPGLAAPEAEPVKIKIKVSDLPEPPQETTPNAAPDGSFEKGGVWTGIDRSPAFAYDTKHVKHGTRSLRITGRQGQPTAILSGPRFELKPNTRYRAHAWLYGEFESFPPRWGGPVISVYNPAAQRGHCYGQTHAQKMEGQWYQANWQFNTADAPAKAIVYLYAPAKKFVGSVWIDDLVIEEVGIGESRNLLPNSGFEHATTPLYPDRWFSHFDTNLLTRDTLVPSAGAPLQLDDTDRVEGKYSCRLRGFHQFYSAPTRPARGVALRGDTDYVLSFYLKSDTPNAEFWYRVATGPGGVALPWQKAEATTEWTRYTAVLRTSAKGGILHVNIRTQGAWDWQGPGPVPTYWIDAAQFESGTEPTAYTPDEYDLDSMNWMALERP